MNSLFVLLGLDAWKPVLTALLLPPVPLLVLLLIGVRLMRGRRGLGGGLVALSVLLIWLGACTGVADALSAFVLRPPAALSAARVQALRAAPSTAIVVLGGGMEPRAPEYGTASLMHASLERLRYGVWLGRQTNLPVAFSGGVGWAQPDAMAEAQVAARIAADEFGRPLKWLEDRSRDTRENASRTLALLRPAGIRRIVLVTHGWHMPRAQRAFEAAAGGAIAIEPAPMGLARGNELPVLRWMPSSDGFRDVRAVLREALGRLAGA
ncbi:MAG TPA: YdcF family protein [Burkholderiaceae bacterium]|nr:YdcF family protein [Burkholderiaceae bacterium]